MNTFNTQADINNLSDVLAFVDEQVERYFCSMKIQMQIDIAIEEIFVNIANYAYGDGTGPVEIRCLVDGDPPCLAVTFIDEGIRYNPLAKEDPDTTLSADERQIGGLGIFMVKKSMDSMEYEYKDGKNILTIRKKLC